MGLFSSRRWDNEPETESDKRFFNLRESGYTGWIDQDGRASACPCCGNPGCTADLTEPLQRVTDDQSHPFPCAVPGVGSSVPGFVW